MSAPLEGLGLAELIAVDPAGLADEEGMQLAAHLIDRGSDACDDEALTRAEVVLDGLTDRETLSPRAVSRSHYFRANLWNSRRKMRSDTNGWAWRSAEADNEILELRRAIGHSGFAKLHALERAQLLTNLGNALNHIGRFVEAIEAWDRALAFEPRLAMANGNRGLGLSYYASALYDSGHNAVLAVAALDALTRAIAPDALVESLGLDPALAMFGRKKASLDGHFGEAAVADAANLDGYSLGRGRREQAYRRWCLNNRLFLNPLNDVGPHAIAGQDVMTLPSITVEGLDGGPGPPAVIHYFNGLKQEFATARYTLYEGVTDRGVHFSDRCVLLYNTLDYPAFGLGVERVKMAFRSAYALLDKIGLLLNVYLGLGHGERQVSFRNLWFKGGKGKELHPALDGLANWPLRGLYWLSKDVFEDAFRLVTEPDAQLLYELRNHLEHKFVGVRDDILLAITRSAVAEAPPGMFAITFDQLAARTLRQLKLVRAALIYLALGIHAEERRRKSGRGDGMVMPMSLDTWDDRWKRRD
ncbi:MAG TPA: LA2681 family HEPN domain-containing protein [Caulobacteraceae bacterium]|jgi:tetratricopeptide (TPR) repeat protein|nr:LA2681 family HEPN domain-containing protein [Caulobacteraceae bacterium]